MEIQHSIHVDRSRSEVFRFMSNPTDLKDVLDRIVLDPSELNRLKQLIKQVASGNNDEKVLKEEILKSRVGIIQELMQFFPFFAYVKRNDEAHILQKALQEREELLEILSKRLNQIYIELKD